MTRSKKIIFLVIYIVYLILSWGAFRYFVRLPVVVEELMFKPIIWLSPLWWWRLAQGKNYKLAGGKFMENLIWGFGGGLMIYVLFRLITGRSIFPEFNLDLWATATTIGIVQGLTFLGGVSTLISMVSKNEYVNQVVTGLVMGLVQLPIGVFVYRLAPEVLLGTFLITFFVGIVVVNIRLKSKSTLAGMLAYWFFILAVI